VVPPDAAYFAAEGALRAAASIERVAAARSGRAAAASPRRFSLVTACPTAPKVRDGLVEDGADVEEDLRRCRVRPPASAGEGAPLALGIDAGSTTIKAVVVEPNGALRASVYRRALRSPLEDAQEVLAALAQELGPEVERIEAFGVTGYAASMLGPVLGADAMPVETLAHARSARHYVPDADVVCDVGGQDIKVLILGRRGVERFHLSSQCAAGSGVLLESTARDLGVTARIDAEVAFAARRAPELTVGCAVFLDTERVTCQRAGFTAAEILAGVAAVLPRNVWENVVAAASLSSLGRVFVLSGGVQRNAAAVKAQVDYIRTRHPDARVVLHPHAGEAGAIGAALAGRNERLAGGTRFVGVARALAQRFTSRNDESTRCRSCPSLCPRTVVEASSEARGRVQFVTGYSCDRGASLEGDGDEPAAGTTAGAARNLLRVEASRLFGPPRATRVVSRAGRSLSIAVPRVLSMYRSAPFFLAYFHAIGVPRRNLVLGEVTSEELWRRAAGRGTVDACFPVKVTQAHVADLLARRGERAFDALFFPVLTHAVTAVSGCADTASCPVVAGTPLVTRAAFACDEAGRLPGGAVLLSPVLTLTRPEQLAATLLEAVRRVAPELTPEEHARALDEARAAQRRFEETLERDGARAIARAAAERRAAIVVLARPYHADPGIHHDIGSELRSLGRTTMSIRALPKSRATLEALGCSASLDVSDAAPTLTNSGDGEKLAGARIVASHAYLVALEVSSFKCGQDAALYGEVADLARGGGKPFLALHDLDETRPVGSLRLRLRTFLDAIERYEESLPAPAGGRA
jgi:predicted CoA-substrate-specific enzyme activase